MDSRKRCIGDESIIEEMDRFILSLAEGSYVGGSIFGDIMNSELLGDEINESGRIIGIVIGRDCNLD